MAQDHGQPALHGNEAGEFFFGRGSTGIVGVNSGSAIASFLLGAVDKPT